MYKCKCSKLWLSVFLDDFNQQKCPLIPNKRYGGWELSEKPHSRHLCIIKAITLGLQLAGRPSFCIKWGMSETLAAFRRTEGSWLYPGETVVESYLPQLSHNLGWMKTGLSNLVPSQVITTKKKEWDKHEEENILKHQQRPQQPGAAVGMVTVPLCFQTIN